MNRDCDITQDLLFGYNDETLNFGSKEFVENHLKTCENCKKIYEEIKKDKDPEMNNEEIDFLKKIKNKNKKNLILTVIITVLAIFLFITIIAFVNYANKANKIEIFLKDNISSEEIEEIKKMVKEKDKGSEIIHKSKDEALREIKSKLQDPKLLDVYDGEKNIFPSSLVVKTKFYKTKEIKEYIINKEGIKNITIIETNPYMLLIAEIYTKYFNSSNEIIERENINYNQ